MFLLLTCSNTPDKNWGALLASFLLPLSNLDGPSACFVFFRTIEATPETPGYFLILPQYLYFWILDTIQKYPFFGY